MRTEPTPAEAASEKRSRSNCDACDQRPWKHRGWVAGIETFYCCQCGEHDETLCSALTTTEADEAFAKLHAAGLELR